MKPISHKVEFQHEETRKRTMHWLHTAKNDFSTSWGELHNRHLLLVLFLYPRYPCCALLHYESLIKVHLWEHLPSHAHAPTRHKARHHLTTASRLYQHGTTISNCEPSDVNMRLRLIFHAPWFQWQAQDRISCNFKLIHSQLSWAWILSWQLV